ncbi:hypothetical protein BDV28DRAFT_160809 [Aspergillus coremiiformis]|uniref:Uncharacterized protein n=1 Tax=Aspergillus coremiiformis TaxID=138285 RepID=A0A5N6YZD0_9EURO|nr:hypothetical protein BDV28DRAFT_160809 [Aspergillus coremiiformis]
MELHTADPDTQTGVDLLILDYLLSTTIHGLVYASKEEIQQQSNKCDLNWNIDTVHVLSPELLSDDIKVKIQLFKFAIAFQYYQEARLRPQYHEFQPNTRTGGLEERSISLPELAASFISLCNTVGARLSQAKWIDAASYFVLYVIIEEYRTSDTPVSLNKRVAWAEEILNEISNVSHISSQYLSDLQPPKKTPARVHWNTVSAKFPLQQFECAVFDVLIDIMMVLEPPVLVQLERGKLWGLSCAETKQLKDRVGLR